MEFFYEPAVFSKEEKSALRANHKSSISRSSDLLRSIGDATSSWIASVNLYLETLIFSVFKTDKVFFVLDSDPPILDNYSFVPEAPAINNICLGTNVALAVEIFYSFFLSSFYSEQVFPCKTRGVTLGITLSSRTYGRKEKPHKYKNRQKCKQFKEKSHCPHPLVWY